MNDHNPSRRNTFSSQSANKSTTTDAAVVLPPGFKMTQLGPLPEEWQVVRLGEVAEFINGFAFASQHWSLKGRPIIRIQNLTGSVTRTNYYSGNLDQKYLVRRGDLLVSWSASLDAFIWMGPDAWLNQHIFKVENFKGVEKDFLFFVLRFHINQIKFKTRGSTMKHVTRKEFTSTIIPLPPLPEQRAIAHVLRRVQEAKEATERVIAALRELKKSLMRHLFTYGPVPLEVADRVPLRQTEIGLIPEHWQVVRLGNYCKVFSGFAFKSEDFNQDGVLVIKIGNLRDGKIVIDARSNFFPKNKITPNIRKFLLKTGDVLIALTGATTGKVAVVQKEFEGSLLNQRVGKFEIFSKALSNSYLIYCVSLSYFQNKISENILKSAQGNISPKNIENLFVPLPPLSEQQEIARILKSVDDKIAAEEKRREALASLFKSLLNNLMTGRIRLPKDFINEFKEES